MFLGVCLYGNAQETGKVLIMKVRESHTPSVKPSIRIINPDGSVEYAEIKSGLDDEETDKKVAESIGKIVQKGYVIKTSHQVPMNAAYTVILTTYVFEKK